MSQPQTQPKQLRGFKILVTSPEGETVEIICFAYKCKDGVLVLEQGEDGTLNIPFNPNIRAWRAIPVTITPNPTPLQQPLAKVVEVEGEGQTDEPS